MASLDESRSVVNVLGSMRDFCRVVFGQDCASMEDDDPRIEVSAGAKLLAIWEHEEHCERLSEEQQRDRLGNDYEKAKDALATYRLRKAVRS